MVWPFKPKRDEIQELRESVKSIHKRLADRDDTIRGLRELIYACTTEQDDMRKELLRLSTIVLMSQPSRAETKAIKAAKMAEIYSRFDTSGYLDARTPVVKKPATVETRRLPNDDNSSSRNRHDDYMSSFFTSASIDDSRSSSSSNSYSSSSSDSYSSSSCDSSSSDSSSSCD